MSVLLWRKSEFSFEISSLLLTAVRHRRFRSVDVHKGTASVFCPGLRVYATEPGRQSFDVHGVRTPLIFRKLQKVQFRKFQKVAEQMRLLEPTAQIWIKIDPYYQRQKCRPMTLVYSWVSSTPAPRTDTVSDRWPELNNLPAELCLHNTSLIGQFQRLLQVAFLLYCLWRIVSFCLIAPCISIRFLLSSFTYLLN